MNHGMAIGTYGTKVFDGMNLHASGGRKGRKVMDVYEAPPDRPEDLLKREAADSARGAIVIHACPSQRCIPLIARAHRAY